MAQDLNSYIKNNSKFLKIEDGQTVTMVYKGFSIIPDRFNAGNETVQYLFLDPTTNKTLPWSKSSTRVAAQMAKIPVGETVTISRLGEGTETVYRIKLANASKPLGNVSNVPTDEEPPF